MNRQATTYSPGETPYLVAYRLRGELRVRVMRVATWEGYSTVADLGNIAATYNGQPRDSVTIVSAVRAQTLTGFGAVRLTAEHVDYLARRVTYSYRTVATERTGEYGWIEVTYSRAHNGGYFRSARGIDGNGDGRTYTQAVRADDPERSIAEHVFVVTDAALAAIGKPWR